MHHRSRLNLMRCRNKLKTIKKTPNKMNTLKEKMYLSRLQRRERHLRRGSLKMLEEERIKRLRH
jgi:hypothetical protein